MADRNPLWVSHAGGVVTIDDARIGISSLWTPGNSNVNARKGLRPGGTTTAASPGLVAQQTVADKTVKVNAFQATIPASRATGSFICTLDAVKNIDLLTTHPAHATLQRNDLIVAQVSDETFDSANGFTVCQIVGTPNASPTDPTVNTTNGAPTNSPDYITLARVRVTANASTITTSMIDDLRPPWMVAVGGVVPVINATDRGTLTPYDGMTIWRIDRKWAEVYSIAAGGWLVQGTAVCTTTSDRDTAITTPFVGQSCFVTADNMEYVYGIPNASAWTAVQALGGGSSPSTSTLHEVRYVQTSTGQTIASNTDQRVNYNTAVYGSNDVSLTTVSGGTEFTLNRAGLWQFDAAIRYTGGTGLMGIFIVDSASLGTRFAGSTASSVLSLSTGFDCRFAAGQKVAVLAFQGTGSNQQLDTSFGQLVSFNATWIRP